jgi:hypothetical protein
MWFATDSNSYFSPTETKSECMQQEYDTAQTYQLANERQHEVI